MGAHPLERQSRCVMIAGRGHRAVSAIMASIPAGRGGCVCRTEWSDLRARPGGL